jgi:hypothetical protein
LSGGLPTEQKGMNNNNNKKIQPEHNRRWYSKIENETETPKKYQWERDVTKRWKVGNS